MRRDNCPLVANVLGTCLEKLLVDRNADGALAYAKKVIGTRNFDRETTCGV